MIEELKLNEDHLISRINLLEDNILKIKRKAIEYSQKVKSLTKINEMLINHISEQDNLKNLLCNTSNPIPSFIRILKQEQALNFDVNMNLSYSHNVQSESIRSTDENFIGIVNSIDNQKQVDTFNCCPSSKIKTIKFPLKAKIMQNNIKINKLNKSNFQNEKEIQKCKKNIKKINIEQNIKANDEDHAFEEAITDRSEISSNRLPNSSRIKEYKQKYRFINGFKNSTSLREKIRSLSPLMTNFAHA